MRTRGLILPQNRDVMHKHHPRCITVTSLPSYDVSRPNDITALSRSLRNESKIQVAGEGERQLERGTVSIVPRVLVDIPHEKDGLRYVPIFLSYVSDIPLASVSSSEAHPSSYPMGAGSSFPGGKARPGSDADHSPHIVPSLE
jgi:hypothetical protein